MLKSPISPSETGLTKEKALSSPTVTVTEVVQADENSRQSHHSNALAFDLNATAIQSSPYDDPVNFLNLQELDIQNRIFALALTRLQSTRPDYATATYMDSFNWPSIFSTIRTLCVSAGIQWQRQEFYLVIFRSKLQRDADRERLGLLDKKSHEEACASGGLLTYWFGSPDSEMQNLATCKCTCTVSIAGMAS